MSTIREWKRSYRWQKALNVIESLILRAMSCTLKLLARIVVLAFSLVKELVLGFGTRLRSR